MNINQYYGSPERLNYKKQRKKIVEMWQSKKKKISFSIYFPKQKQLSFECSGLRYHTYNTIISFIWVQFAQIFVRV